MMPNAKMPTTKIQQQQNEESTMQFVQLMSMRRIRPSIVQFIVAVLLATCTGGSAKLEGADVVLARVQDEAITVADLALFQEDLMEGLKDGKTGFAADSLMLESIIDKKVMILEAKRGGIDREPWFGPKMTVFYNMRVLKDYVLKNINHKVVITDEELQEHFVATDRHRALRFAGILVETELEAEELLEELAEGADFAQLARERSLFVQTKDQGGDIGRYLPKDATSEAVRDKIFHLQIGGISEPIKYRYDDKWRYVIFKILDEAPVPFWDAEDVLSEEIYQRNRAARQVVLTESLMKVYDPQLEFDFIGRIARSLTEGTMTSGMPTGINPDDAICTYRGGVLRLRDLQNLSQKGKEKQWDLADSSAFIEYLQEQEIPFKLFLEEARKAGTYEKPDILKVVDFERQDQLVSNLKTRAIDPKVTVTEAEARAFYDTHAEAFLTYYEYEVVEILVAFEDLAKQLRDEIDQGADPEKLAAAHTIRKGVGHHGGRFKLELRTEFRSLYRALEGHEEGEVVGPVRLKEGYSVFKVLYNSGRSVKPYNKDEERRARAFVRIKKMNQAYRDFVGVLRERYPIEMFWEELERLHPAAS